MGGNSILRRAVRFLAGGAVLLLSGLTPDGAEASTLSGEVKTAAGNLGTLVVYLKPVDAQAKKAVAHQVISQKGRVFAPGVTVLVAGGSVTFVNDEDIEIDHNVYSLSQPRQFDIGLAARGSKHTIDFPETGTVKYYCSVHKNMEGTVVVVPSPYFAILDNPGPFKIDDVPSGRWQIKIALFHNRYTASPVDVSVSGQRPVQNVTVEIVSKRARR